MADLALNMLNELLTLVGSRAKEEVGLLWNFKDDLKDMGKTLAWLKAALHDAGNRSDKEERVRLWLAELRYACYDIQDMLDDYMPQYREQNGHDQLGCVELVKVCVRNLHSRIDLARKMKNMRARLDNIADLKNKYDLKQITVLNEQIIDKNRETFSASHSVVLGRDEEQNEIVNMIINNQTSEQIYVIPIFGMGGLGKTTLANLIFNDSKLRDTKYFDVWAWAYIGSKDFHFCNTGSRIISSLKNSQFNCDNLEIINQEMKKEIIDKRFLIVLDDVWNVDKVLWDKLINMLINISKGGTIVVTTRIERTAKDIASDVPYPLKPLSEKNCILLFQQKAFKSEDEMNKCDNLVKIGKDIAMKCRGVALTAIALGGILNLRKDENIWLYVKESEMWELYNDNMLESTSNILSGLLLSYNLMPNKLKPCFAYCSTYPKGHRIKSHKLVQHWISLNFIRPDSSRNSSLTLHDSAQIYLDDLISFSFLQRSNDNVDQFGNNIVSMHDLMHDLARHVAKDHDINIADDKEDTHDANKSSFRYVSIHGSKATSDHSEIDVMDAKVRAISLYSDNVKLKDKSFSEARSLRVLETNGHEINLPKELKQLCYFSASHIPKEINLPNLQFLHLVRAQFEALPESIGNFERLLYLDLSFCKNLATLPESISNLQKLSHLDLSLCLMLGKLPERFGNLKSLQYLNLSNCVRLVSLPESFGNLQKLSHLDWSRCRKLRELPECLGNLKSLQHLNLSECENLVTFPESFGNLHQLLHLNIRSLRQLRGLPDCLGNLKSLQYLHLQDCQNITTLPESIGKLEKLSHLDLSRCSILGNIPKSFGNLKSLQHLNLSRCKNLVTLPVSICNLQKLSHLDLSECSTLGNIPESFGNLKSLQHLNLSKCENLVTLPESICNLQKLSYLDLSNCKIFRELPECFGNLKSLEYLKLSFCENLETLPDSIVNLQTLLHLDLQYCDKLEKLPEHFSNLKSLEILALPDVAKLQDLERLFIDMASLRHLSMSMFADPLSTSSMKLIRRLAKFETLMLRLDFTIKEVKEDAEEGKEGYFCSIVCLEKLNMLDGHLTLTGLENVKDPEDAVRANLKQKHKVGILNLIWNGDDVDDDHASAVLQNLQPSPELIILTISGYGGRQWPSWMIDNLTELTLEKIPRLKKIEFGRSQFPSLKEFYIKDMEKLELLLLNSDRSQFPYLKLEDAHIEECPCLTRISLPPSVTTLRLEGNVGLLLSPAATIQASSLERLVVVICGQLVTLPEWIGELSSLKEIEILGCRNIQSLPNSMRQLTQLKELNIYRCSKAFRQECEDPNSENWSRIQHIPKVVISEAYV